MPVMVPASTLRDSVQVDWKVGQEVAVITTAWTDEPDPGGFRLPFFLVLYGWLSKLWSLFGSLLSYGT